MIYVECSCIQLHVDCITFNTNSTKIPPPLPNSLKKEINEWDTCGNFHWRDHQIKGNKFMDSTSLISFAEKELTRSIPKAFIIYVDKNLKLYMKPSKSLTNLNCSYPILIKHKNKVLKLWQTNAKNTSFRNISL